MAQLIAFKDELVLISQNLGNLYLTCSKLWRTKDSTFSALLAIGSLILRSLVYPANFRAKSKQRRKLTRFEFFAKFMKHLMVSLQYFYNFFLLFNLTKYCHAVIFRFIKIYKAAQRKSRQLRIYERNE